MRSLNNQIKWVRRLQTALSIGLAVMVLLFVFAGYLPAKHRLDALHGQIESKTREVEDKQNKAQNLPLLALEVNELESRVRDYDRQFPRQADLGDFIKDITRVSQQLALRDFKYQPAAPKRGDGVPQTRNKGPQPRTDAVGDPAFGDPAYFELPIQMNFQGDFLNVNAFLSEVEHLSRLTRVRKLAIHTKDIKSGVVEVEIGLNIYYSEG